MVFLERPVQGPSRELIIPLNSKADLETDLVGGKALSLIALNRQGFPIPDGIVLTTSFFRPWFKEIEESSEWAAVLASPPELLPERCEAVRALLQDVGLDFRRRKLLAKAVADLLPESKRSTLAVRSSSPEEDLASASFAGAYATLLGVPLTGIEDAIRRAVASCYDPRVWRYKEAHGRDPRSPRIAVIIQEQVTADAAGVAFSIDPQDNSYDKVVINANFGLGESVVSGISSPDHFTVDKRSGRVEVSRPGSKEVVIRLDTEGGTYWESAPRETQLSLTERQAGRIARMTAQVEVLHGAPVDIEWALAGETLCLLQSRPITKYFPVPVAMQSKPGEPKSLYIDYTLAKQGVDYCLSVMGSDIWERLQRAALGGLPEEACRPGDGLLFSLGGRFFANLSYYFKMQGRERTAAQIRIQDTISSQIISRVDSDYTARKLPRGMRGLILRTIIMRVGTLVPAVRALCRPEASQKRFSEATESHALRLKREADRTQTPLDLADQLISLQDEYMTTVALPATLAAEVARSRIRKLFPDDGTLRDRASYLERALPNNVTIQMGLDLAKVATDGGVSGCPSPEELSSKLRTNSFSPAVMSTWQEFLRQYGHRCARELDVAAPRYREDPGQLHGQLVSLADRLDGGHSAGDLFARGAEEREAAYKTLLGAARSAGRRRQIRHLYRVLVCLGAYKEINKYYIVRMIDLLRQRILEEATHLVEAGRLDHVEEVFDLTLTDLERSLSDPSVDVRALASRNTEVHRLFSRVDDFPRIFDSRGRILRAPARSGSGREIVGEPVSPGIIRGPVKVLANPTEKVLLAGEILVARATDPGWTPLFVSAAGIILEVGGVLQHGAVVAREFGKPCVVGIEGATDLFTDGEHVELDGGNGIVRRIPAENEIVNQKSLGLERPEQMSAAQVG